MTENTANTKPANQPRNRNEPATSAELDIRWRNWQDNGLPSDIETQLARLGTHTVTAAAAVAERAEEIAARLGQPRGAAIDRFLNVTDDWAERTDRIATVRTLEVLTAFKGPAMARPCWRPPAEHSRRRTLTGIEIGLVRLCALRHSGSTVRVAALDAGGLSGELDSIFPSDVIFDVHGDPTQLQFCGTHREIASGYPPAAPRILEIPAWSRPAFKTDVAAAVTANRRLLYKGKSDEAAKIQSSVLMGVHSVLCDAGLGSDPTVRPLSIRNTFGRAVYDTAGIEAAAQALGHDDWMAVAREIGVRPHAPVRQRNNKHTNTVRAE